MDPCCSLWTEWGKFEFCLTSSVCAAGGLLGTGGNTTGAPSCPREKICGEITTGQGAAGRIAVPLPNLTTGQGAAGHITTGQAYRCLHWPGASLAPYFATGQGGLDAKLAPNLAMHCSGGGQVHRRRREIHKHWDQHSVIVVLH